MAIDIKAPLVDQLFAIGQNTGSGGNNEYKSPIQQQGSYHGQATPMQKPQQKGSGGAGALASIAGTVASSYMGQGAGAAPVAQNGTGYAMGGNLTSGSEVGNTQYAGSANTNPLTSLFSPKVNEQAMPVDNGTTPQTNPYALNYANAPQRQSLFGAYGQ